MNNNIIRGSVVNHFGEKCFLKFIENQKEQTECCFYNNPCENHIYDKEQETKILNLSYALKELISIVEIHSKCTNNNFAWAELSTAKEVLEG